MQVQYAQTYYPGDQSMNAPINKPWVSQCSPIHWEFNIFVLFCTQSSVRVIAIVWCCGDEGSYGWFLLSEYAFFIKYRSLHERLTIPW